LLTKIWIISFRIAVQLANPSAAANFLDELEKCYSYLKTNPLMYEQCSDVRLQREGYRKAFIKNYVLVYKADSAINEVIIYRFFYGAQDYAKLL
jgi:plasmid stabilization system protein ParE